MEFIEWLADKSPEFVIGFAIGLLAALLVSYIYLLPKLVKNATAALTKQVELLSTQVLSQTAHIAHLEQQITKLENELGPYRQFAEQQLARIMVNNHEK